jgi:hypothetical protein
MRSLLLVESFDLHSSNQYILMRVIPSCFPFSKMCLCLASLLSRCSPRYLKSSRGSCTLLIVDKKMILRERSLNPMGLRPVTEIYLLFTFTVLYWVAEGKTKLY